MIVRRINPNASELYHHGVKGQRWGIRRYQNPDGSLTADGRKRYGYSLEKNSKLKQKEILRSDETINRVWDSKEFKKIKKKAREEYKQTDDYKKNSKIIEDAEKDLTVHNVNKGTDAIYKMNLGYAASERRYIDNVASIYLKELGFEDTEKGRNIVKKYYKLNFANNNTVAVGSNGRGYTKTRKW